MEDKKISPNGEPKFTDIGKWFENFWYHYKAQTIIAAVAIFTVVICVVQFMGREVSDYYLMYAGPQVLMLQDITYMEKAVEEVGEDVDGNGTVSAALDDIVLLSPDEQKAAMEAGAVLNGEFMQTSLKEFRQQIFGGDAVVCLLSPYTYEMVHSEGGFMKLSEIFDTIPESAYDDCGIVLSETEFGQHFMGIKHLPKDTILCVRRISSMAQFKGQKKTEEAHQKSVELFCRIVEFTAPEGKE